MQDTVSATRLSTGKLIGGIALLTFGTLAFFDAIDFWHPRELWRYWPLFLIVIGVGNEIDTWQTRKGGGGIVLIAIGVWMLAGSLELFGLDYGDAFPLGIVVLGLGLIVHALLGVQKEKDTDEQQ